MRYVSHLVGSPEVRRKGVSAQADTTRSRSCGGRHEGITSVTWRGPEMSAACVVAPEVEQPGPQHPCSRGVMHGLRCVFCPPHVRSHGAGVKRIKTEHGFEGFMLDSCSATREKHKGQGALSTLLQQMTLQEHDERVWVVCILCLLMMNHTVIQTRRDAFHSTALRPGKGQTRGSTNDPHVAPTWSKRQRRDSERACGCRACAPCPAGSAGCPAGAAAVCCAGGKTRQAASAAPPSPGS